MYVSEKVQVLVTWCSKSSFKGAFVPNKFLDQRRLNIQSGVPKEDLGAEKAYKITTGAFNTF